MPPVVQLYTSADFGLNKKSGGEEERSQTEDTSSR